jgi:hypothetical protein
MKIQEERKLDSISIAVTEAARKEEGLVLPFFLFLRLSANCALFEGSW